MNDSPAKPRLIIATREDYEAAVERLHACMADAVDGADQDEFFEISAAMVAYETRNHAAKQGGES